MKLFYVFLILFFFNSCSFDNKSGIWRDESKVSKKNQLDTDQFIDLNELLLNAETFNQTVKLDKNIFLALTSPINNSKWNDVFYSDTNNLDHFEYGNFYNQLYKSKKLSRNKSNNSILFHEEIIIFSDEKGSIVFFSLAENKIIDKFNFYKKKFKNIEKKLNIIISDDIVYVSDNLGYLYSYSFKLKRVLWAKNHKIPFRSNLKIKDDKIYASNLNNDFLIFNKLSGNVLKQIPTETTIVKNKFINNISLNENTVFFLNSYGSLYAIDQSLLEVKWFINFNQSVNLNPSNLFLSNQIINFKEKIVISSNFKTYVIGSKRVRFYTKKTFLLK